MSLLPLILVGALLGAPTPAPAAVTIPLARYGPERMRTVRVVVAGDTLDFLFDTAGGLTTISAAVAAKLGCVTGGRVGGVRMTGQRIEAPVCRDVPLTIGGVSVRVDAAVLDIAPYGDRERPLGGMVSLHTLPDRPLTLDMARGTLTIETPETLARRVRGLAPVKMRVATGESGGGLTAFVAVPAGPAELWFEWDSNHNATTFVAPWAARLLGLPDSTSPGDVTLALPNGDATRVPVEPKPGLVHDGVLSAAFVERGVWTIDARSSRLWVTPLAPLHEPPAERPGVAPGDPAADPVGWYDVVLIDRGQPQQGEMHVTRAGTGLTATLRFDGDEHVFTLRDVRMDGGTMSFGLPMRATYPFVLRFTGPDATGTWGDPATRGGAATARRRS